MDASGIVSVPPSVNPAWLCCHSLKRRDKDEEDCDRHRRVIIMLCRSNVFEVEGEDEHGYIHGGCC